MDLGLEGAAVFVQGGTRGMGRAAAECFAADGARVAVMGRTKEDVDAAADALGSSGAADVIGIPGDIRDDEQVRAAFRTVGERWGHLNVLVNMAGPDVVGGIEDLDDDAWVAAFDMGTLGMVRCCRAAIPLLRAAEWGRIVNVSAHSTKRQTAHLVAYSAAKSAVTSISKNLSLALAPDEILVNTCLLYTSPSPRD